MWNLSLVKLTETKRKEFEEGEPLVVKNTAEAMDLELQISKYFKVKWAGEEKLGFHRIDIKKDEYPIIIYMRDEKLWWDNHKEEDVK